MPEYELRLRFTAADDAQAERLAEAWADTCAAEYGTRYAGCLRFTSNNISTFPSPPVTTATTYAPPGNDS